ncbi:MAG TPA: glycosyltransferase [Acidimicrobiales bacterium]
MPFVEPANRLVDRGHDVTYLVPAGYHEQLAGERFRLGLYPLDMSSKAMHADPEHERLLRHPTLNGLRLPRYWMRKAFVADPEAVHDELVRALTGADAAVLHPTMSALAGAVAEALGIPVVVGHLFPMALPTADWRFPVDFRLPNLGARANRAAWQLYVRSLGPLLYDRPINALRRRLGLPPAHGNVLRAWMNADRIVVLVSPRYYATETPPELPVTWGGFSHWAGPPGTDRDALDPDVETFLDAGEPPVLVTLGTSAATGAGPRFAAMASALDELGLRSLLLVGNEENLAAVAGREGAFVFAPLAPVLARCRVAVISGSLGTMAAALAAGVPVVTVAEFLDQRWHGQRAEQLGVGLVVRRPRDVPAAVARIEADSGYRERARDLAGRLAAEDGPGALADAVESVL